MRAVRLGIGHLNHLNGQKMPPTGFLPTPYHCQPMTELPRFDHSAPVRLVAITSLKRLNRLLVASVMMQSITLLIQLLNLTR